MIKFTLQNDSVLFLTPDRVLQISKGEADDAALAVTFLSLKGENTRRRIKDFEILQAGTTYS